MKVTHIEALQRQLTQETPVVLIVAADPFDRREACQLIGDRDAALRLDGERLSREALLEELGSMSLLSQQRIIVIEGVDHLSKGHLDLLAHYCRSPDPRCTLVLMAATPCQAVLREAVDQVGIVFDAPAATRAGVLAWLATHAKSEGLTLESGVAQALVDAQGLDRTLLTCEVKKLAAYVNWDRPVTCEDVASLCSLSYSDTIWDLGRAILERAPDRALRACHALFQAGAEPLALVAQLRAQMQNAMEILALSGSEGHSARVARRFPYLKGRRLLEAIQRASCYGSGRLTRALCALFEVERRCKSVKISQDQLLEALVARLSS